MRTVSIAGTMLILIAIILGFTYGYNSVSGVIATWGKTPINQVPLRQVITLVFWMIFLPLILRGK